PGVRGDPELVTLTDEERFDLLPPTGPVRELDEPLISDDRETRLLAIHLPWGEPELPQRRADLQLELRGEHDRAEHGRGIGVLKLRGPFDLGDRGPDESAGVDRAGELRFDRLLLCADEVDHGPVGTLHLCTRGRLR